MEEHSFLYHAFIYLAAAVVAVPISKRLGLGSVLGYLCAGFAIGPWGFQIISEVGDILHFSEFGVVLLLFLIGLELNLHRLWSLKVPILGLGGLQVMFSTITFTVIALGLGLPFNIAVIAGMGLSLSSTAMALQILQEKNLLTTHAGHSAFSILLFQDIVVIPMLAIIPLLGVEQTAQQETGHALAVIKVLSVIIGIVFVGHFTLRPLFRMMANTNIQEIFTAFALLLVIGIALLMHAVGMSMALGAFLAGVLLADSEYRHELEIAIEPFKGLLLGLFFISVGMSINFGLFMEKPFEILALMMILVLTKILILYMLGKVFDISIRENFVFAFVISQGGEFAFVLFSIANQAGIIPNQYTGMLMVVVALSMVTTPLLMILFDNFIQPRFRHIEQATPDVTIDSEDNPVIIAGFGRFGQTIGRLLHSNRIGTTILDHNPNHIELLRKYGYKVFYGDVTRLELLKTAGADKARIFVIAIDSPEEILDTAKKVKKYFPHLTILARATNRTRAHELMGLGITLINREVFCSALGLGEEVLKCLGYGAYQARKASYVFRDYDAKALREHLPFHKDEVKRISLAKEARKELEEMFDADEEEISKERDQSWG